MIIYLDPDYKCHISDTGNMVAVETDAFDGKCDIYTEGYRFIPSGSAWTREDGTVFHGEMISPWKDWNELDAAQREYEREQIAEYNALVAELSEVYSDAET